MKQEVSILNIPQPISDLQLRIFFLFYSFFYDEYSFKGFDFTCQSHTTDIPYLHHILSLLEGGGGGERILEVTQWGHDLLLRCLQWAHC